jgi:large repetitive protein
MKVVFFAEPPQNGDGARAAVRGSSDAARRAFLTIIAAVLVWMLFGAARAEAVPSVSYKCTPAPQNCVGWYKSNVAIDWIVTPSDATIVAGCQDKSFTTDTPGTNEFCKVDDGEATVTVELRIKLDKTPPTVLGGSPGRAADVNGWYNNPVSVAFTGTDQTSGIDACTSPTYSGPDSGAGSLTGTCIDKAGNVGTLGYGLKYDATAPSVTAANPASGPNANGWFNQPVAFQFQGSDPISGIDTCTGLTYAGPETATGSVTGRCRDVAGNTSSDRSFPVKYDATAPKATGGQPKRAPDKNGWYNASVGVDFSGTDELSGVQSCTSTTYSGPGEGSVSVPGTCTDRAGNVSTPASVPLKYDDTAPDVTAATPARVADANGWYNQSVEIAFAGDDATSGVDACTRATYAGPDSATASLSGTCTDRAGNVSGALGYGLKYDATDPVIVNALPERGPNSEGWFNRSIKFNLQANDATSGIAGAADCPSVTYSGPDSASGSFNTTCQDRAGNSANRSFSIKYDATAPTAAGSPRRLPDRNGWYRDSIGVDFSGADQTSGLLSCTSTTYSGPDAGSVSVPGTCTDRAGNVSASASVQLKYDGTDPVVTGGAPVRLADVNGWYNHSVDVVFSGTDGTSGVDTCTRPTYAGPDSATASIPGTCTDRAGNVSVPLAHVLKYDATKPDVAGVTPERAANPQGWFNGTVRFDLQASDATSGIVGTADCPPVTYSGPDSATASFDTTCRDRAGNTTNKRFELKYDETPPDVTRARPDRPANQAGWYSASVTVDFEGTDGTSQVASCTRKTYSGPDTSATSVTGTCIDRAGNVSDELGFSLKYDGTPPTIDSGVLARSANEAGWYNSAVEIAFGGNDPTSGLDGCTRTTYDGPDSAAASVTGTCTDLAGNRTGPLTVSFKYDDTPPDVVSAKAERDPDANGWYTQPVTFVVGGTDATSGIQACPDVTYRGPDGPAASVVGLCRDHAGNLSSRPFGLQFDAHAPPIMDLAATPADRAVTLSWRTTADAESVGVTRTPGRGFEKSTFVFGGPGTSFVDTQVDNGVPYTYEVRLQDPAGNSSSETVTAVPSAPPVVLGQTALPVGLGVAATGGGPPVIVTPSSGPGLIAPAKGAVFRPGRRPLLQWTPVPGASYYNVQLFRDRKILSTWTSKSQYRLKLSWRYRGRRYRLGAGEYHWIVWPGFGPRSKADYGRRVGRRGFEVRARAR